MDPVLLARIQFAVTVGFHFLFPPLSIGLAWMLVWMEWRAWRRKDPVYERMGRFWGRVFALTFAVGVATGIVMEFQFGTNWAEYSKFVGDIFGAPLAIEAIFAFFIESTFLGFYLFGRGRLSKRFHWFSILMVAIGATLSAFWILVANSWQQTPAGFEIRNGRAELTSFAAAVFNESTFQRFHHTISACFVSSAFLVIGIGAWMALNGRDRDMARRSLAVGLVFGFVASVLTLFPFGHTHAQQVARTQPEKFAAIEGLYSTTTHAPLVIAALPERRPPRWRSYLEIPGLLSWMAFGDITAEIRGIDDFPEDEIPPLLLTFASFHFMVGLGLYFIAATGWGTLMLWRRRLFDQRWFLHILFWSIPLPLLACQSGWITAEVGRQPWIVYGHLRTADAISKNVSAGEILFSLILFSLIYAALLALYIYLLARETRRTPLESGTKEAQA